MINVVLPVLRWSAECKIILAILSLGSPISSLWVINTKQVVNSTWVDKEKGKTTKEFRYATDTLEDNSSLKNFI